MNNILVRTLIRQASVDPFLEQEWLRFKPVFSDDEIEQGLERFPAVMIENGC